MSAFSTKGLVLTRRPGESIILNLDGREIEILYESRDSSQQIRMRVYADSDVMIYRKEIWTEMQRERRRKEKY